MTDTDLDPLMTCIVAENAFTAAELDTIVQLCDALILREAELIGDDWQKEAARKIRVTRIAGVPRLNQFKWIYDRVFGIIGSVNTTVYKFDLTTFSEVLQYTVYSDSEGGHYDWHIDSGLKPLQRKLSMSLQLSDPASYEECDLQFYASQQLETAPRERGAAIVFPSYTLHRVTPIRSGVRKSLVAWAAGPQFR